MKKTRAQYQTQISDGQLDPMSTEELQDLILRARWALYRRIRDASVALKESDPGSHWSPPTKDDDE